MVVIIEADQWVPLPRAIAALAAMCRRVAPDSKRRESTTGSAPPRARASSGPTADNRPYFGEVVDSRVAHGGIAAEPPGAIRSRLAGLHHRRLLHLRVRQQRRHMRADVGLPATGAQLEDQAVALAQRARRSKRRRPATVVGRGCLSERRPGALTARHGVSVELRPRCALRNVLRRGRVSPSAKARVGRSCWPVPAARSQRLLACGRR